MRQKSFTAKGNRFHALKAGVFVALASGSIALFGSTTAHAAVLSVGPTQPNEPFNGGYVCADVSAGNLKAGNKIQAWGCHAGPNQQFDFIGYKIYALGGQRCLDVFAGGTAAGSQVDSATCNGTPAQEWYYFNGQIVNLNGNGGNCLDATSMSNGTQLVINPCNGSESQNWQIK
jgi:hypothetical protein